MNVWNSLEKKVYVYCEDNRMLTAGDRVVIGVSGGADSVCLLFLLCAFREKLALSLKVVHVHHGIRTDAAKDATYVKELCESLQVPFVQVNADVPRIAREEGLSEEEAGRKVRYQSFFDCAETFSPGAPVKLALAHHMGDRAETLLFHLIRGSGIKGLGSIQPVRETQEGYLIIRPLLGLGREEIEAYLVQKGVNYCQDSTNFEDDYARNRIRHHILPYAEEEICHGAIRHLNEAAELLTQVEDYLTDQVKKARTRCVSEEGSGEKEKRICVEEFLKEHPLIQNRLLLELLYEFSPSGKDIGAVHVEALRDLFFGGSGRRKSLPFGIRAIREYAFVRLTEERWEEGRDALSEETAELALSGLSSEEERTMQWGTYQLVFRRFPYEKKEIIPEKTYTKWFDYDKIKDTLSIRARKKGDFLMIRGEAGRLIRKTVKDYMITVKIPREQRNAIPLLTEGKQVLWIPGYRIGENYKVDEKTKTILQVTLRQGSFLEEH